MEVDPGSITLHQGRFIPKHARLTSRNKEFVTEIVTESHDLYRSVPDRLFTTGNLEAGDDHTDPRLLAE